MSLINYLADKIRSGLITFLNIVTLANHDYPYHDYATFAAADVKARYTVGENNKTAHGDQKKLFVSKSTLIYSTGLASVRFNNANNVAQAIIASVLYKFETNIKQIFIETLAADQNIYIYCEGVLPEETRSPL